MTKKEKEQGKGSILASTFRNVAKDEKEKLVACRDTWRWSYIIFFQGYFWPPAVWLHFLLGLRLGSVGGKQSGSLFCWASALKDPAASNASAICSVSPLTPVTPTLGPPRVLAGGGAVGSSVFLIWEGIWRTGKWSHLHYTRHSVYRCEMSSIQTEPGP